LPVELLLAILKLRQLLANPLRFSLLVRKRISACWSNHDGTEQQNNCSHEGNETKTKRPGTFHGCHLVTLRCASRAPSGAGIAEFLGKDRAPTLGRCSVIHVA
jgi:hypothetical protein